MNFTESPSFPAMPTSPLDSTPKALHITDIPTSQTEYTFRSSKCASPVSDHQRSEGDCPEIDVTVLIRSLLKKICEAHGNSNGYRFSVTDNVESLVILICGTYPKCIPDMVVKMHWGNESYSIVDYKVCSVVSSTG